ncbi:hypothetical protein ACLUWV_04150 [Bifidobacterium thermophilum]|uniref:hypothetical protein n=1 Tax=Bifidobacterium thermophilum TaxID=33905 RepID=UPI00296F570F|nr:hypothetical protein [Bifidobacterium thermophilum]
MAEIITENDITDASIGDAAKPVQSMPGRCQDQWQKGMPIRVCHGIHNPLHPARNHVIAK